MRKAQRTEILEMIKTLEEAHQEIKTYLEHNQKEMTKNLLADCQEVMVSIGNAIETFEGEGHITVSYAEQYCDTLAQIFEEINTQTHINENKIYKNLNKSVIRVENSIKNDIRVKREAVFLPYKASMWDSLESVYLAAKEDPDCDAYVIPIPYFDKNPDGSFKQMHYEADQYPENVPITKCDDYDFGVHHPDMIFIHNPYDDWNTVTSVPPFFFSANLKKFTDCLVYIPYFATAGGMSEGQALCPAYINADYIVIQSEKYRKYYDPRIPNEKFLPLGSPKFDSVIKKCQNPPNIPEEWKDKIINPDGSRKKVYFYNTSIAGMLGDTTNFLKKMEYVFETFKKHNDVCLLWRPHPLMESTFDSMRAGYKPEYEKLKQKYLTENIGIYDLTPGIENTIALSDVYIGDSGTSVTSLFGVVGKPMFILNNAIHKLPKEEDLRGEFFQSYTQTMEGVPLTKYYLSPRNELYYSPKDDGNYQYFCELNTYAGGSYYQRAVEYENKIFVFPSNAQDILVIDQDKRIKKIPLKQEIEQAGAFSGFWITKEYAFILPYKYSSMVRFNMKTQEINYISGIRDFNIANVNGEKVPATRWHHQGKLYFLNGTGDEMIIIDVETLQIEKKKVSFGRLLYSVSCRNINDDELWFLPYQGTTITRWNMVTDERKDYDLSLEGMTSFHRGHKVPCDVRYFSGIVFDKEYAIVAPSWGNQFVKFNIITGEKEEWEAPFSTTTEPVSDYISNGAVGYFYYKIAEPGKYYFFYNPERKSYAIDLTTKEITEVEYNFDKEELEKNHNGFNVNSQWLQYCCNESATATLEDLLDEKIKGKQFNKEKQIEEFAKINASTSGECGEKVYQHMIQ